MYFNGGRSVSGPFWPDYHLGGSRRGGLGGSDCILFTNQDKILSEVNVINLPILGNEESNVAMFGPLLLTDIEADIITYRALPRSRRSFSILS